MGNVISFEKAKKRKEDEYNLYQRRTRIATARISLEEIWKNIEKEEERRYEGRFGENYSDMLTTDSMSAAVKMQYFAAGMMKLVPDIFHYND